MVQCILAPFVTRNTLCETLWMAYIEMHLLCPIEINAVRHAFSARFRFAITFILSEWHESVQHVSNTWIACTYGIFARCACERFAEKNQRNVTVIKYVNGNLVFRFGKWYWWKKPIYFCVALNRGVRGHFVSPFSHNRPVSARFSFLIRSPLMYHYNVTNGQLTLYSDTLNDRTFSEID